jgi:hypothetical protein
VLSAFASRGQRGLQPVIAGQWSGRTWARRPSDHHGVGRCRRPQTRRARPSPSTRPIATTSPAFVSTAAGAPGASPPRMSASASNDGAIVPARTTQDGASAASTQKDGQVAAVRRAQPPDHERRAASIRDPPSQPKCPPRLHREQPSSGGTRWSHETQHREASTTATRRGCSRRWHQRSRRLPQHVSASPRPQGPRLPKPAWALAPERHSWESHRQQLGSCQASAVVSEL